MGEKVPQADSDVNHSETSGRSLPVPGRQSHRASKANGKRVMRGSIRNSAGPRKPSLIRKTRQRNVRNIQRRSRNEKLMDQSEDPGVDVKDGLQKFRKLRAGLTQKTHPAKTLTTFQETYSTHPIYHINRIDQENEIPGIEVGTIFYSRAELSLVGLHRPLQAGIQTKVVHGTGPSHDQKAKIIATSVIHSGKYEDDEDEGGACWYTGEGGNDLSGTGRQIKDQELTGGNLALLNSKGNSLRFTRKGPDGTYSYDGLYKVMDYKETQGKSKFKVYRFRLERLPGQKQLLAYNPSKKSNRKKAFRES